MQLLPGSAKFLHASMVRYVPLLLFVLSLFPALRGHAQERDTTLWDTDGYVGAIVRTGNTIYVGGRFSLVGPRSGPGVVVNRSDGQRTGKGLPFTTPYNQMQGVVYASVADGSGGWYAGGDFSVTQDGITRKYLVHILPDGRLDAAWNPNPNREVSRLALSGDTLYATGGFSVIGGEPRNYLAALGATTGKALAWNCSVSYTVHGITPARGRVYLHGEFSYVNGQPRNGIAAVDQRTGALLAWDPGVLGSVMAIQAAGDSVILGGNFTKVGDQERRHLAAVDVNTGRATGWHPDVNNPVWALAISNATLYAGGTFFRVNQTNRSALAAFHVATGELTPWNPVLEGEHVSLLHARDGTLYVAGVFHRIDGQYRNFAASFDAAGQLTPWNPSTGNGVSTISPSPNGGVFIGGTFRNVNCVNRNGLAAFDAITGEATPWNPDPKPLPMVSAPSVYALEVADNQVYVGGSFSAIGGQAVNNLAAVDAFTGRASPFWTPNPDGAVGTLKAHGDALYVAGPFRHIGGREARSFVALNRRSGKVTGWTPAVGGIRAIAVTDKAVYVGGDFYYTAGGKERRLVAALDPVTGQAFDWGPEIPYSNSGDVINTISISGNTIYAGGSFTLPHDGQQKENLIAIDIPSGQVTGWNAQAGFQVYALAATRDLVYVSSSSYINGISGKMFAALDATTGLVNDAGPAIAATNTTLTLWNGVLYVGGEFVTSHEGGSHLAAFGRTVVAQPNYIRGNITAGNKPGCAKDGTEKALANILVAAEPGPYFGLSDSLGNYSIAVDTGTYVVRQVLPDDPGRLVTQTCPASEATHTASFKGYNNTVTGKDFGNQVTLRPYLTASVASTRRRRCFPGNTTLTYCNSGSMAVADAKVHLELPPHVVLVSANAAYTIAPDKHLVFDVGTLAPNQCGSIQLTDSVVCDNPDIRGLTQCTKVWITPANATTPPPDWDGSDVTLKARCLPNGRVRLGLYNTGTGAMTDSSAYRIYLDAALVLSRNFRLAKGDSLMLQVPANGQTVRLEADQRPGHPARQSTNVSLEACGTGAGGKVSLGFVAQLPQDDAEPEADTECLSITDSFDPNDKLVLPTGVTMEHYTAFGQELAYTVRFQNTGNDYAYKVVVVDTLSEKLDISTLRVNGASHPYNFTVSGKGRPVLTWTFDNIALPDSARDQAGSNGLVKFTIRPKAGLPDKTRIENYADIFFDYNPPVRTNTTLNTLHDLPRETTGGDALPLTVCTPNPPVTAGPDQAFCGDQTTVLQAQLPAHGGGRWQRISGAGRIAQPHHATTAVEALGYGDNVFEWRIADGSCANDSLRARVTVTRYRNPDKPAVASLGGNELQSTVEGGTYQWYCNGLPLPDHTRSIKAGRGGLYTVRVSGGGDCPPAFSEPFDFPLTGPVLDLLSAIYPNPAGRDFTVALPGGLSQVTITLFDGQGKKVAESTTYNAGKEPLRRDFHRPACRAGVYLVKIQTPEAMVVKRLVLR